MREATPSERAVWGYLRWLSVAKGFQTENEFGLEEATEAVRAYGCEISKAFPALDNRYER